MCQISEKDLNGMTPLNIIPHHYDISLKLDIYSCTFDGSVNINITVNTPTTTITLDTEKLNIKSASIIGENSELKAKDILTDIKELKTTLIFPKELNSDLNNGYLKLDFDGDNFYTCIDPSDDGISSFIAVICFNSINIKRCFPCWDDPSHKATFDLTLVISQELTALSNMPIKCETKQDDLKTVIFNTTPRIFPSSLAIVLGEFEHIETKDNDIDIRVYTLKGQSNRAQFSLRTIGELLSFYNTYFDHVYPLPKLDCIDLEIPFKTWDSLGLIIFPEHCLLTSSDKNISNTEKQLKRLQISRKLVGQWIGALMSPKNWQEQWLYDGLATFFQYMSVSELYLENGSVYEDFISNKLRHVFELDSLTESQPLVKNWETLGEISSLKAPSLICMLQTLIGSEIFQKSIASFIRKYVYKEYTSEDLWQFLDDISNEPIKEIMACWTQQAGYPILKVEQRQEGEDRILKILQQRFIADGSSDDSLWIIPMSIITAERPHQIHYRTIIPATREVEVALEIKEGVWIAFHVGYYRVIYSKDMISELIPAIENKHLHEMHRFSILNDLFNSAKAGYVSTKEVLNLIPAYKHDKSYMVWNGIANCLTQISSLISHLSVHEELIIFCNRICTEICDWIGWNAKKEESYIEQLLRSLILENMALLQDSYTLREAERIFQVHLHAESVPEYLRRSVYIGVVCSGKEEYLEKLLSIYFETESKEEKDRIFYALGAVRKENLLHKVLLLTISDQINPKYSRLVFQLMSISQRSRKISWKFVKEHWSVFSKKYCGEYMSFVKKWATRGFVTETEARDVEIFLKNHEKFLDDPVNDFVEQIKINTNWLKRDAIDIDRALCLLTNE